MVQYKAIQLRWKQYKCLPALKQHASVFTIKLKLISKIIYQLKSGFQICQRNSFRIQGQTHTQTDRQTDRQTHTHTHTHTHTL